MTTKAITTPVSVRIPPELLARLDARAREELRTRNSTILWLLSTALEQSWAPRSPGTASQGAS